jgi:hypothetical protein
MDLLFSWAGRLVSERNISLYALRQHTEALTQATDKDWGLYEDTREINPRKAGLIHHPPHPSRNQPPKPPRGSAGGLPDRWHLLAETHVDIKYTGGPLLTSLNALSLA